MAKSPIWMPLFVGDYLRDTSRLSTEQHGAYLLIIMDYFVNGVPPDDDRVLANIAKMTVQDWRKIKPAIARYFHIRNGVWWHHRIEREIDATEKRRLASVENGKKGGRPKGSKNEMKVVK